MDFTEKYRSPYRCEMLERLPSVNLVHHVESDGTVWGTSKRSIMAYRNRTWEKIAKFPCSWPRDLFGWCRPLARASRADKCNVYVNKAGRILGIRGMSVYAIHPNTPAQPLFQIQGDCVLHGSVGEDSDGWSYFGEYFMNPGRQPVSIWKISPDLETWQKAHEFPSGSIRHVHTIQNDPYDQGVFWVTVGDFEGECHLFRTADRFRSLERFGDGTQIWRAVNLFFTEKHVCWLTDSHLDQNFACRMHREDSRLEVGQEIACSTWYGTSTLEGLYIAFTTVEKGPAIKTKRSSILVSRDAFNWQEVFSFRKDFFRPVRLFKYGVICCPSGRLSAENLFISGEGLVGLDGISLRLKITG